MFEKLKQASRKLKSELQVLLLAYRDKRTPLVAKVLVGLTVAYLLSPIDLIPDFIPVLGILDDLVLVPLMIKLSLRLIPKEVISDARAYAAAHPESIKKNNLVVAVVIIAIWLLAVFAIYSKLVK